jgi:hypothetical protein
VYFCQTVKSLLKIAFFYIFRTCYLVSTPDGQANYLHRKCRNSEITIRPSGNRALKTPRLPPITIRITAPGRSIALTSLVSAIKFAFRPRNAAEQVDHESALCGRYPFCSGEHEHSVWHNVGDFRDGLMAGIEPPSREEVAAIAGKRAVIVALNMRLNNAPPSGGEDLEAVKQTIEILKLEFRREEAARSVVRQEAQQVIDNRIKALLDEDVAVGRLVIRSKNEYDYVTIDDLVRWAEYRNIVVEQKMPAPAVLIRRTSAGNQGDYHSHSTIPHEASRSAVGTTIPTDHAQPEDWKVTARKIADECFDHDTNSNPPTRDSLIRRNQRNDPVGGYAVRVMEKMLERGVRGPRGPITNASTIAREALQGQKWWALKSK